MRQRLRWCFNFLSFHGNVPAMNYWLKCKLFFWRATLYSGSTLSCLWTHTETHIDNKYGQALLHGSTNIIWFMLTATVACYVRVTLLYCEFITDLCCVKSITRVADDWHTIEPRSHSVSCNLVSMLQHRLDKVTTTYITALSVLHVCVFTQTQLHSTLIYLLYHYFYSWAKQ